MGTVLSSTSDVTIPRQAALEAASALAAALDRAIADSDWDAAHALSAALAPICERLGW